jgi:hypothetical protein
MARNSDIDNPLERIALLVAILLIVSCLIIGALILMGVQ